jgi:hypothetical protein
MLRMLRREERRLLTGRCTITRGTYPDLTSVVGVPCVVRPKSSGLSETMQGGAALVQNFYDVRLSETADVRRGDVLTITASDDPQMVGRFLTVRESTIDEWQTVRRVVCEESVA